MVEIHWLHGCLCPCLEEHDAFYGQRVLFCVDRDISINSITTWKNYVRSWRFVVLATAFHNNLWYQNIHPQKTPRLFIDVAFLITRFTGPTWDPSGADRTQVCPMCTQWTFFWDMESVRKLVCICGQDKYKTKLCIRTGSVWLFTLRPCVIRPKPVLDFKIRVLKPWGCHQTKG